MGLIVRSSEIHAAGCYTTSDIPKDTYVVEYTGPRISQEEADARYDGKTTTYLFGLIDPHKIIDGHGVAMFINHSCEPNCDTAEIDGRVWIVARRNIKADEELTYDYNLYDGAEDDPAPCSCGAKNCRGTMYSLEEIRRWKREYGKEPVARRKVA